MSVYQANIHRLFKKTRRQLGKASAKPQPGRVHQLRTSIRRLEAVLEELSPQLDRNQRKLLKILGSIRRRAGKVRDLDVHITALRNLKVSGEARRKTQILSRFAELRSAREKKLVKMFDRVYVRELGRRLKRAEKDLRWPEGNPDPLVSASASFARLAATNDALTEENLHQYRIRGKQIRYVAELAGDDPQVQVWVKTLKRMQDALGEWHDWLALSDAVAKLVDSPNGSPLLSAARNIARAKLYEAVQAVTLTKNVLLGEGTQPGKKPAGLSQKNTVLPRAMASAAA